jgi:hypothetical protein
MSVRKPPTPRCPTCGRKLLWIWGKLCCAGFDCERKRDDQRRGVAK